MMNQSDKYLEETLLQAKKHDLPPHYIRRIESEMNERLEKERMFTMEVYRNNLHN
ncbi:hypothetical protein [Oceanobacillus alkalisoli]|uniref:hypothetical protein n=1 Tax=Oceanobacillus alkalisoli TaxID=2925113 RepID=UPI001EF06906|nr:hypothetical protein [Oceanobacillus alkalisoli]MCF3944917.1 hypothetical protein [Oceanobacillus alkalisoli]MCG5105201.1 hypothetical protein [Oceanobacillus alkalisoli]